MRKCNNNIKKHHSVMYMGKYIKCLRYGDVTYIVKINWLKIDWQTKIVWTASSFLSKSAFLGVFGARDLQTSIYLSIYIYSIVFDSLKFFTCAMLIIYSF